jgi:predicted phage terminase large subunit-like protein
VESVTTPRVLTPAGFARVASRGTWRIAPHLDLLNRKLLEVASGRLTRLMVSMPPRSGKSEFISKFFPAYYLGTFPEKRVILASHGDDFATEWGGKAQLVLAEVGPQLFGVEVDPRTSAAARWNVRRVGQRRPSLDPGGMIAVGIGGPLVGRGGNLLIIDDYLKNAEEAQSQAKRNALWDWFTTTARTRTRPGGFAIVILATRWHEDDLIGRLLDWAKQGKEKWEVINIPALAEENDVLGRQPGEPLWPDMGYEYSKEYLEITRELDVWAFEALFQGRPRPKGGGMFKEEWIKSNLVSGCPADCDWVRVWDFASSENKGDYTAGVLMGKDSTDTYYVRDVVRGRWSPGKRNETIKETSERDAALVGQWSYRVRGELQPGGAGKDHAGDFVKLLAGFDVNVVSASGDKEVRARPFASQCEYNHVKFFHGEFLDALSKELCDFPRGKYDDQVDACSYAFNCLALAGGSESSPATGEDRADFLVGGL